MNGMGGSFTGIGGSHAPEYATHYSHGSEGKDIDDSILSKIKRQLKLDRMEQLYGLKNCPFKSQDYFNLLKEKNVISD